jgi:hypothetical protein
VVADHGGYDLGCVDILEVVFEVELLLKNCKLVEVLNDMTIPKREYITIALGVILKSLGHIVKRLLPGIKGEDNLVRFSILEAVLVIELTVGELDS